MDSFVEYVLRHHRSRLIEVLEQPAARKNYGVVINFYTLLEEEINLGNVLLTDPDHALAVFDQGLIAAQEKIVQEVTLNGERSGMTVKRLVYTRILGFPPNIHGSKRTFPGNDELGLFMQISGTVVRVTLPFLLEYERDYLCSKCASTVSIGAEFEMNNALLPPSKCPTGCVNAKFTPVKEEGKEKLKDYQEVKIQEEPGKLHQGSVPSSIWVTLDNDLVDVCHPGDHVTVWGVVKRRWKNFKVGTVPEVEVVFKGNNLQVTNHQRNTGLITQEVKERFEKFWLKHKSNPLIGRDIILASFCPDVYGLYILKLALCVVLCGGTQSEERSVRSEPHMLMIGDPGTGKSHLLRFAHRVASRAVLTTGVGSTTAGLTVCAVREGGDWHLEAGALVLADGGVCCIDELNTMKEHDRMSLHEAMEQQTISVAKAGMVTKLNTRCTVLAATNAKQGGYDPTECLSVNTALASPLLSRFDLIIVLQDTRSEEWDRMLSSFILKLARAPNLSGVWDIDELRTYLALARTYTPRIGPGAHAVLSKYYQAQRAADARSAARTTLRMLESLVRLSQGHAKLMMRDEVTVEDAVITVTLMECSMGGAALVNTSNTLHAGFPDDPLELYRQQATQILLKLQLSDLLKDELSRLDDLKGETCPPSSPPAEPRPDPNYLMSQRLTDLMSDIRRKKDRETWQAAAMTGKGIKRKKGQLVKMAVVEEENPVEQDEPVGLFKPKKRKVSERLETILEASTESVKEKVGVKIQSTLEKLQKFKKPGSMPEDRQLEEKNYFCSLRGTPAPVHTSTPAKPKEKEKKGLPKIPGALDIKKLKALVLKTSQEVSQKKKESATQESPFTLNDVSWENLEAELEW